MNSFRGSKCSQSSGVHETGATPDPDDQRPELHDRRLFSGEDGPGEGKLIVVGFVLERPVHRLPPCSPQFFHDPSPCRCLRCDRRATLDRGDQQSHSGYLCTKKDGQPYHPEVVSRSFRQAVKKAMLPMIRPHDLRHTHATLALQAGIHPKVVSERLGHANVSITLDTYSHAIPAMQEEAAERIAELVSGET